MNIFTYIVAQGARLVPQSVALSAPKSVAALAAAERALGQAMVPFVQAYGKALAAIPEAERATLPQSVTDAILAVAAETPLPDTLATIAERANTSKAVLAARADIERLTATVAADRLAERPVVLAPRYPDGTAASWRRYTLSPESWAAYLAETDGEKRAAILGAEVPAEHKSTIGISRATQALLIPGIYADRAAFLAACASGTVAIPNGRGEKSNKSRKPRKSADERTAEALDILFGAVDPAPAPDPAPAANG